MTEAISIATETETKQISRHVSIEKGDLAPSSRAGSESSLFDESSITRTPSKTRETCEKSVQTSHPILTSESRTITCGSRSFTVTASPASTDAAMALSSLAFSSARRNFWGGPPPKQPLFSSGNSIPKANNGSAWNRTSLPYATNESSKNSQVSPDSVTKPICTPRQAPSAFASGKSYVQPTPKLAKPHSQTTNSNRQRYKLPSSQSASVKKTNSRPAEDSRHIVTPTPKKMKVSSNDTMNDETYSRKAKSLGLLCENFCKQTWENDIIGIDEAAKSLGVERRRIYDIINILESLEIVERKCKNQYQWKGFSRLPEVLSEIQSEAIEELTEEARHFGILKESDATPKLSEDHNKPEANSTSTKKSLGRLSRQFLQLFLVGNKVMSLTEASDRIMGKADDAPSCDPNDKKAALTRGQKTKIRRLYDIANVLASIGLVQKMGNQRKARPTFSWIYHWSAPKIRSLVTSPPNSPMNETKSILSNINERGAGSGQSAPSPKQQPSKLFAPTLIKSS